MHSGCSPRFVSIIITRGANLVRLFQAFLFISLRLSTHSSWPIPPWSSLLYRFWVTTLCVVVVVLASFSLVIIFCQQYTLQSTKKGGRARLLSTSTTGDIRLIVCQKWRVLTINKLTRIGTPLFGMRLSTLLCLLFSMRIYLSILRYSQKIFIFFGHHFMVLCDV